MSERETKKVDRRCGSQGVNETGNCLRCGYLVDPECDVECPPGYLDSGSFTLDEYKKRYG